MKILYIINHKLIIRVILIQNKINNKRRVSTHFVILDWPSCLGRKLKALILRQVMAILGLKQLIRVHNNHILVMEDQLNDRVLIAEILLNYLEP